MKSELVDEIVEKGVQDALISLVESTDDKSCNKYALKVAEVFFAAETFKNISKGNNTQKLVSSFHKNLVLLIQKTWVEKSDEALKAQVLYHLDEFCTKLESEQYSEAYSDFFGIVDDMVYLMFGNQTKSDDFDEYAVRIDPEFGIFWWYVKSLPRTAQWSQEKSKISLLLGMYFLANY